jgi:hypothetical protein
LQGQDQALHFGISLGGFFFICPKLTFNHSCVLAKTYLRIMSTSNQWIGSPLATMSSYFEGQPGVSGTAPEADSRSRVLSGELLSAGGDWTPRSP